MVFLVFFINTNIIAKPFLKNIRISKEDLETRLVLDLSEKTKYKVFTLNRPNRVVVDLYRTNKSSKLKSTIGKKGLISKVRIANNTSTKLRVVIETEDIVFYKTSHIPSGSNTNFRVVIDLKKAYEGSRKLVSASVNKQKMIIAIDPGHGGKDEGTRGKKIKEKDLVLKIAKRLKSLIDNEKNMRAILIRDDDSFPCPQKRSNCSQIESLNERVLRAKNAKAHLFISIHADSFKDSKVRGATLYALSDSRKIAKGSDYKMMYQPKSKKNIALKSGVSKRLVNKIKVDQVQAYDQSKVIGQAILSELKKDVRMRKKIPIEAQFAVLKSTEIASVLIETSYLSNPSDEKFLINPINQNKIAAGILRGIKLYNANSKKEILK